MSKSPKAPGSLAGLLQTVGDRKLREVVRLVETSGQRSSLEPELAAMRCRLRKLKPQRPLTIQRLLTAPFEASLIADQDNSWTFVVRRSDLEQLHVAILDNLDPAVANKTKERLSGSTPDDEDVLLEVGRQIWPLAADAMAEAAAAAPSAVPASWQRVADLLRVGSQLMPLLCCLLPLPSVLQSEDKELLATIMALAQAGTRDRLGTVLTLLVRAARKPQSLAQDIVEASTETPTAPLRTLLDQVLAEQRASIGRRIATHAETPEMPLTQAAEEAWRFAEVLADDDAESAARTTLTVDDKKLRERAASAAQSHYATAIENLVASYADADLERQKDAVKACEEAARCCAKLGQAARRLKPDAAVGRLTEAMVERLANTANASPNAAGPGASVDTARLIEILAGPDVAWRYLSERRNSRAGGRGRQAVESQA